MPFWIPYSRAAQAVNLRALFGAIVHSNGFALLIQTKLLLSAVKNIDMFICHLLRLYHK